MRTARSSSCSGGESGPDPPEFPPLGVGLDLIPLNFPLGCGPGSDSPEFPPWVWASIWSPSISTLGVGLDLIPLNFHLGCGPGSDPPQFPPWVWAWRGVSLAGGSPWHRGVSWWGSPGEGGLPGTGGSPRGGLPGRGVSLVGGLPGRGGSPWQGGLPACIEADPPVDRHTPVKS